MWVFLTIHMFQFLLGLSLTTLATFALEKPLVHSQVAATNGEKSGEWWPTIPHSFHSGAKMSERKFFVEQLRIVAMLRWCVGSPQR